MDSSHWHEERMAEAADWLVRLSSGSATESEIKAWIDWCSEDERNLSALEDLEGVWRTIGDHPPPAAVLARLLARDTPDRSPKHRRRLTTWRMATSLPAIGAALALAVVMIIVHGLAGHRVARSASLTSALGQDRVFVLWDGSRVELGGSSVVTARFTRRQRLLTVLQGEAYFQESRQADWPFVVAAGQLKAVARGTSFDVVRGVDEVAVSVVDGIVDVSVPAPRATAHSRTRGTGRTIELNPGHQLVLSSAGIVRQQRVDPHSVVAWREGELESPDAPLSEFVEAVDRYSLHPIVIADPSIGSLRYTGTAFTQSIDDWVDGLPAVFPIVIDRTSKPGTILLKPR